MRLLTRSDFDGLVCAALLEEAGVVDSHKFIHPKDLQDGKIEVTENDCLANVPYAEGCGMWFDHHSSEEERVEFSDIFKRIKGASESSPSCARVVYNYLNDKDKLSRFEESGLLEAVDKCDSGNLTHEEIIKPKGWILLSFVMDPRSGFGHSGNYRISNLQLMKDLIQKLRTSNSKDLISDPDLSERLENYYMQQDEYEAMIRDNSQVSRNVLVINLLKVEQIATGNRFTEYVMFPDQNVSVRIMWGYKKQNVVISCGKSITNRSSEADIGSLMLKFGGGGHKAVGTCQVPVEEWKNSCEEILRVLRE